MDSVNICWLHTNSAGDPDLDASKSAAQEMVTAYKIAHEPVLNSRHVDGRAIDMTIKWTGDLVINDADGNKTTITTTPRTGMNSDLQDVGAGYGVIKLVDDAPHWSDDGH